MTAVLTHHLGWVATVCSSTLNSYQETALDLNQPYNLLWSQLSDLYGAVGYPIKTAQTVITGSNKNNIINKLLSSLTYFIRYGNVDKQLVNRCSIEEDNKKADIICIRNNIIPKEKKYEDHLKELMVCANPQCSDNNNEKEAVKRLTKIKSSVKLTDLINKRCDNVSNNKPLPHIEHYFKNDEVPKSLSKSFNMGDLTKLQEKVESRRGSSECGDLDVIFVLGDNEKLVGLKKDECPPLSGAKRKTSLAKRPSTLDISKSHSNEAKTSCKKCMFYHSSSFDALCPNQLENKPEPSPVKLRAHSEPPEVRKVTPVVEYRHSRVKFSLQQYPQVVKNYMKSKNIELEGLSLGEKVFDKFATVQHNIKLDLSGYESESEEVEALHTPSNASELEFSPDMGVDLDEDSFRTPLASAQDMKVVNIPMPK